MVEDGSVFKCYDSMWDTIFYSELGSSWSVLQVNLIIKIYFSILIYQYQSINILIY